MSKKYKKNKKSEKGKKCKKKMNITLAHSKKK